MTPLSRPQQIYKLAKDEGRPIPYTELCERLLIARYEISGIISAMMRTNNYPGLKVVTLGTERVKTHNHTLTTRRNPIRAVTIA